MRIFFAHARGAGDLRATVDGHTPLTPSAILGARAPRRLGLTPLGSFLGNLLGALRVTPSRPRPSLSVALRTLLYLAKRLTRYRRIPCLISRPKGCALGGTGCASVVAGAARFGCLAPPSPTQGSCLRSSLPPIRGEGMREAPPWCEPALEGGVKALPIPPPTPLGSGGEVLRSTEGCPSYLPPLRGEGTLGQPCELPFVPRSPLARRVGQDTRRPHQLPEARVTGRTTGFTSGYRTYPQVNPVVSERALLGRPSGRCASSSRRVAG